MYSSSSNNNIHISEKAMQEKYYPIYLYSNCKKSLCIVCMYRVCPQGEIAKKKNF